MKVVKGILAVVLMGSSFSVQAQAGTKTKAELLKMCVTAPDSVDTMGLLAKQFHVDGKSIANLLSSEDTLGKIKSGDEAVAGLVNSISEQNGKALSSALQSTRTLQTLTDAVVASLQKSMDQVQAKFGKDAAVSTYMQGMMAQIQGISIITKVGLVLLEAKRNGQEVSTADLTASADRIQAALENFVVMKLRVNGLGEKIKRSSEKEQKKTAAEFKVVQSLIKVNGCIDGVNLLK